MPRRFCICGCGNTTSGLWYRGHDQVELHKIIARYGTVLDFLKVHGWEPKS